MPIYSLLSELDRKVILFTHEKRQRDKKPIPNGALNEEFRAFIVTEGEYILWELEKRKLTEAEVVAHAWLVTSANNISLVFDFKKNNQLSVSSLFDDEHCIGVWQLEHGILKVCFEYHGHSYDINIIANNNRSIHSALQIIDNESAELLKVAPISDPKNGKALID
ncbi:hypothetical protein CW745_03115 [Psychromonas sp. psych-6C06]|uniref:hypothetical protein n=1 Tax=Psychromonas sp. psych-6C06 TaxID=2058089 RepID=UPI000C34F210|nr:hypothetical protein [Psychromonas sp. psych-6C06]PKF63842.1 hypothetical protein CW745_03115 [Psychromonas sp. psych-6C06]